MRAFTALLLLSTIALAICQNSPVSAPSTSQAGRVRILRIFKAPGSVGVKAVAVARVGGLSELDAVLAGASFLPFPTMAFSYFTAEREVSEDITTFSTGRFSFAYRLVGIVEYEESGTTEGYQYEEDTVVSYYTLRKQLSEWEVTTSREEGSVRVATATTTDGVVSFILAFAGSPVLYENKTLNGDNFKFGLKINYGRSSTYSGRNDTSLALVTLSGSKKSVKEIENTNDLRDGFEVPSDDEAIEGSLTWDSFITANRGAGKVMVNIVTTLDSTLHYDTIALNITNGWTAKVVYHSISLEDSMSVGNTELYWDPELGAEIDYEALAASSATTFIASVAVIVSAVVALLA